MREISIEELHRDTSQWVKLAAGRESIVITDGGQRIAELTAFEGVRRHARLPNREDKIKGRSAIQVDSGDYISEMRG